MRHTLPRAQTRQQSNDDDGFVAMSLDDIQQSVSLFNG